MGNEGVLTAEVVKCPGTCGDNEFWLLQVNVPGFRSPYVLMLALPAVGYHALAEQADPLELYRALEKAINGARIVLSMK